MEDNKEHTDAWEAREMAHHHTFWEEYQEYRYWKNGRVVSLILAGIAMAKKNWMGP